VSISIAAGQQAIAAAATPADDSKPAAATQSEAPAQGQQPAKPAAPQFFDIDEYRVDGADSMPEIEVGAAVYPFLGPHRTAADVEKARTALEKSYHDKGYQTVSVAIPPQNIDSHVVVLKVTEGKVGVLRVKNARYFDIAKIKEKAPSLKEGGLPNFKDVTADIVGLNQWPDRRVTPTLRAGVAPGTVDVDLNVEDKPPIHASVELNNRQSPNTTSERLNATVHYDNLWQLGHSFTFTYQVAPERTKDAEVFSASYLARINDSFSMLAYGLKSASDVAAIGGLNVVGPGETFGTRAILTLPSADNFFHTISFGADYKNYGQTTQLGTDTFSTPVSYYPLVASYSATWQQDGALTQLNAGVTVNLRGLGSGFDEFDAKRFAANSSFTHVNADLSRTQDLASGYQVFAKVQGQVSDGPLVSSEQFSLGGMDTVRGYLESEVLGDNGWASTIELRSPDIGAFLQGKIKDESGQGTPRYVTFNEWRAFAFGDMGYADIYSPLPGQEDQFRLASYGFGARFKSFNVLNGMVALAIPVNQQTYTRSNDPRLIFRVWGEF
jgi:hemolysin activation/secretion protein